MRYTSTLVAQGRQISSWGCDHVIPTGPEALRWLHPPTGQRVLEPIPALLGVRSQVQGMMLWKRGRCVRTDSSSCRCRITSLQASRSTK